MGYGFSPPEVPNRSTGLGFVNNGTGKTTG